MEIKNAETKLEQADSFLTKLKDILKKHWGILMILGIAYFFYWAFTTDFEELPEENAPAQQIKQGYYSKGQQMQNVESPYITDQYYELDKSGDTLLIQVWSDGVETVAE
jgi:Tfp pilus assembly protein PilO